MASHQIYLLLAVNLLLIISTNGRVFQKNNPSAVSISDIQGKPVSLQANGSFTGQTNADDVQGLNTLVTRFPSLAENNRDPCISPRWTWIECNSDARPRIIALNLTKRLLFGSIPVFSSMTVLQRIDLSHNYLSGNIPPFLGTFSNLEELNVADNLYTGYIPDSIACNKNLKLWVSRNIGLYVSSKCSDTGNIVDATVTPYTPPSTYPYTSSEPVNVRAVVGGVSTVILLVLIGVGICLTCRHRNNTAAAIPGANADTLPNNRAPPNDRTIPYDQKNNIPGEEMPVNSRHAT